MKSIAKYLSILALLLTIGPPAWFMLGRLTSASERPTTEAETREGVPEDQPTMKAVMLAGAVLWFASAPQWLREDD